MWVPLLVLEGFRLRVLQVLVTPGNPSAGEGRLGLGCKPALLGPSLCFWARWAFAGIPYASKHCIVRALDPLRTQ